jgi:hypothetical protein
LDGEGANNKGLAMVVSGKSQKEGPGLNARAFFLLKRKFHFR